MPDCMYARDIGLAVCTAAAAHRDEDESMLTHCKPANALPTEEGVSMS